MLNNPTEGIELITNFPSLGKFLVYKKGYLMASEKIISQKKNVVKEITDNIKNHEAVILFTYQGLSVADLSFLRKDLKKMDGEVKVYKNTLTKRALDSLNITMDGFLEGPNAVMFSNDIIGSIKSLANFAKGKDILDIKVGIINSEVVGKDVISQYATIPSLEGLLSMVAGGLIEHVKNFAIGLDLYAKQLEEK